MNTKLLEYMFPSGNKAAYLELQSYAQIEDCLWQIQSLKETILWGWKQSDSMLWHEGPVAEAPQNTVACLSPIHLRKASYKALGTIEFNAVTGKTWTDQIMDTSNLIIATAHGTESGPDLVGWEAITEYSHPILCILIACMESPLNLKSRLREILEHKSKWAGIATLLQQRPNSTVIHPISQLPLWFSRLLSRKINQELSHGIGSSFISWFENLLKHFRIAFLPDCEAHFNYKIRLIQKKILDWEGIQRPVTISDIMAPFAFVALGNLNSKIPKAPIPFQSILKKIVTELAQKPSAKLPRILIAKNKIMSRLRPEFSPGVFELDSKNILVWYPLRMPIELRIKHLQSLFSSHYQIALVLMEDAEVVKLKNGPLIPHARIYGTAETDCSAIETIWETDFLPEFEVQHYVDWVRSYPYLCESRGGFYDEEELLSLYLAHELGIHLPRLRHGILKLCRISQSFLKDTSLDF